MSEEEYEDSSSDEDDDDYVPDEEELSEDEELPGEIIEEKETEKKKGKKKAPKRKKKGGIKLDDEEEEDEDEEEEEDEDQFDEQEEEKLKVAREEEKKKAKIDDLWASFKKDTAAVRPKATTQNTAKATASSASSSSRFQTSQPAKKVTITKTFDFAGEEVKITKSVDADSKEAQKASEKPKEESNAKPVPGPSLGVKRAGGLGSILGNLGKKPKISTLEKSKLDWETFKEEKGISDELQHHNKDGYLEKQAFLTRTDWNSFEREKALRNLMRKNT